MADTYVNTPESGLGNSPDVNVSTMEANNRVVTTPSQAVDLTERDILDARNLIINARRITASKQGKPPFNPKLLKDQLKAWKTNISTRFLQKELNRAAPRLYMPILTASTLTAASLPPGWPKGQEKTQFFRDVMTRTIRSWRKNDMFWRGLKQEVVDYGFAFACWTDKYEWRPHLCRMDRGFVPKGTEVMDTKIARFTLKWDYRPDELLKIVRDAVDAGSEKWDKDAVARAVDYATQPSLPQDMSQLRKWEEMIRQQAIDMNTPRAQRMIETRHLWVLEFSGKVSHYLLWPKGMNDNKVLFEDLDAYDSPDNVVIPQTFGYGDGTIHGSWGLGQLLFDLALKVERIRCDSIDNLLNSNKARLQVPNAKDAATAQLVVNDTTIIATGAQFAQNVGGIAANAEGYLELDNRMTQWAQEIGGSYLPPIPLQPSDIKAAQVNAAVSKEQETQRDNLESSLKQDALVIAEMIRRLLDPESDDEVANATREELMGRKAGVFDRMLASVKTLMRDKVKLLEKLIPPPPVSLTEEEITLLVNQPAVQSVSDFTEYAAGERAKFAASVQNNPLFNQASVARWMAAGVPNAGYNFVDSIVVPEGDTTSITVQTRQQLMENTSMMMGAAVPVAVTDAHQVHLDTIKGPLEQAIQGGLIQPAQAGLDHAMAHFAAGSSTKTLNPTTINQWKSWLASMQKAIDAKIQEQQQLQQAQQQLQQVQQRSQQLQQMEQQRGIPTAPSQQPAPPPMAQPPMV